MTIDSHKQAHAACFAAPLLATLHSTTNQFLHIDSHMQAHEACFAAPLLVVTLHQKAYT
jgi:hypothetical protein|tara:strand:- start:311 stop:487 length:177 start_codon:yes stop_codon:yes gene_type:complete